MRRSFLILALLSLTLLGVMAPASAQSNVADWTYMIYYNGDNSLEGFIYGDMTEIQQAGSTDQVNYVAQIDRAPGYTTDFGNWTDTRRFLLQHETQPVLTEDQKLDDVLAYFYAQRNGVDYHTLIAVADALRLRDPATFRKKLTDISINPDDTAFVDQLVRSYSIGREFNTQPVQDMGELDMGDPQTLVDFMTWAMSTYPAKHYALSINSHGGGWLGLSPDETNNNDLLQLPELVQALGEVKAKTGVDQLDLIDTDACLMGQLEVYRALAPYTKYVLASEDTVPGKGYEYATPFTQLNQNPTMDAQTLGTNIINAYMAYYAGPGHWSGDELGLVDEGKIQPVVDALKTFTDSADQGTLDKLSELGIARVDAQRFSSAASDSIDPHSAGNIFSSVDLISFMNLIAEQPDVDPDLKSAAQNIITTAQAAMVDSAADAALPDAHGMAIYFPINSTIAQSMSHIFPDAIPYPAANPNMSAWNHFLDTFHKTIDTALTPDKLKISIEKILPDSGNASIYDPPVVIFDSDSQGIASLQFLAVQNQDDGTNLLVDSAPLTFQSVLPDGTTINELPSGVSQGNDFAWSVEMLLVSDATSHQQSVLFINDPGVPRGSITGTHVAQSSGQHSKANLIFSTDTQAALGTYGTDANGQVSEIRVQPGDQFIPDQYVITADGITAQPSSTALVYGAQPFTYKYVPAASGNYSIGMQIADLARNTTLAAQYVTVKNDGLDPNWRGFKDVERGVNFLYPWGWPDPSVLTDQSGQPDQLEVSDPNGDVRIDVAKRDGSIDKVAQDVVDLENGLTDAQVDAPVPFGSDPTFAQWITYSYTAGDGTPRSGAVIVRRVDSNDATYTFDVDSPEAKLNYAQAIMEKMVNSLTFFTPFTPPDTSSSTLQP